MKAFLGKKSIKTKFLNRIAKHVKADELVQGYGYWEDGKGCAVGCTLHSSDHGAYEIELGIPRHLARLEDAIFERLPVKEARTWPGRFLSAPKVGVDLSLVWPRFAVWLLTDSESGVLRLAKRAASKKAIQDVSNLWQRVIDGETVESLRGEFLKAKYAAADATTAYAAAAYAATAADATAADAAYAAAATTAATATAYAARKIHWQKCSEKLLQLMAEA